MCDEGEGGGLLLSDQLTYFPQIPIPFLLPHTMWKQSRKTSAAASAALGHKPHACEGRADSHKPSTPYALALPPTPTLTLGTVSSCHTAFLRLVLLKSNI